MFCIRAYGPVRTWPPTATAITITIKTPWGDAGVVEGRSTQDAALGICMSALGDLGYNMSLSIEVLAANGWEHLAFKQSDGKCHRD